ncbi:hypothetical protein C1646_775086 [Rhizophagus diaphanus]|nr:hypothetical protein C1646_775086 [Rhizophagus diaphanus] [Rhizophagus sp. MUCL 43196]
MSSSSTLADKVKEYETESLIKFLQKDPKLKHIEVGDGFFMRLEEEKITGDSFLKLTGWEFKKYGMTLGQALDLEEYIKRLGSVLVVNLEKCYV